MSQILVIEDEPSIADNITYALKTEGFDVMWKSTGAEGLEHLTNNSPDLLILDIGLPDASGFDLCREIRKTSRIPIIFLTARSNEIDRVVGLEIGGDDYVTKPFSPRELSARVKALLRRAQEFSENKTAGLGRTDLPFEVDENKCSISYYKTVITLTRYEFRMLKLLIKRPGWVFSREQLMDAVWEDPETSVDRTVDAHIKTLRAKLRKINSDIDPIITHRGLGYSLRDQW